MCTTDRISGWIRHRFAVDPDFLAKVAISDRWVRPQARFGPPVADRQLDVRVLALFSFDDVSGLSFVGRSPIVLWVASVHCIRGTVRSKRYQSKITWKETQLR